MFKQKNKTGLKGVAIATLSTLILLTSASLHAADATQVGTDHPAPHAQQLENWSRQMQAALTDHLDRKLEDNMGTLIADCHPIPEFAIDAFGATAEPMLAAEAQLRIDAEVIETDHLVAQVSINPTCMYN